METLDILGFTKNGEDPFPFLGGACEVPTALEPIALSEMA